jgi:hypothetical protein
MIINSNAARSLTDVTPFGMWCRYKWRKNRLVMLFERATRGILAGKIRKFRAKTTEKELNVIR